MRRHAGVPAGGRLHIATDQPRNPDAWDFGPPLDWTEDPMALPSLDGQGNLVLPINCQKRFRWWAGGQSVRQTMADLGGEQR